jgi:ABC-type uncharacterized transport system auxiliary subunit
LSSSAEQSKSGRGIWCENPRRRNASCHKCKLQKENSKQQNASRLNETASSVHLFFDMKDTSMHRLNLVRLPKAGKPRNKRQEFKAAWFFGSFAFCLLLFAVCFLPQGCGGVPETFYYTLAFDPGPPFNNGQALFPYALGVEKFQAEVIYDDDRIIYRDSPYEVKYYHYRRWVAPPRHLITEKVLRYLAESGLFEKVVTYPSSGSVKYVLGGRLLAFEEWDEQNNWYGKVNFKAHLYEPSTNRVIWNGQFEHTQPIAKKIPVAVVEAISLGLKKCLDDLVKSLAQELEQQNPTP